MYETPYKLRCILTGNYMSILLNLPVPSATGIDIIFRSTADPKSVDYKKNSTGLIQDNARVYVVGQEGASSPELGLLSRYAAGGGTELVFSINPSNQIIFNFARSL